MVVVVALSDLFPEAPNPEAWDLPPKTLGFEAPIVPNGDDDEEDKDAKPELANAEADVICVVLLRNALPNVGAS